MTDKFDAHAVGLTSPADNAAAVTPNDSTALENTSRAVYVGVGGDLNVTMAGGQTVLFEGVASGSIVAIRCTHILATSTTATSIVSIW